MKSSLQQKKKIENDILVILAKKKKWLLDPSFVLIST